MKILLTDDHAVVRDDVREQLVEAVVDVAAPLAPADAGLRGDQARCSHQPQAGADHEAQRPDGHHGRVPGGERHQHRAHHHHAQSDNQ